MGLKPALFSNPVYQKMNLIRVTVSNSPTKIPTMKQALYGGMAPAKKGKPSDSVLFLILDRLLR